jgi:hypothetical protein
MPVDRLKSYVRTCSVLGAVAALLLPAPAGAGTSRAPTYARASTALTTVNEYGRLQKQSSSGASIEEKGIGWGSFNCSVLIELTLSGTLVTSRYTAYLQGGSISGTATAHIHSATTVAAYFSGTITLMRGTGSRSGASGTASFAGTISRTTYAMTTHIAGKLRL